MYMHLSLPLSLYLSLSIDIYIFIHTDVHTCRQTSWLTFQRAQAQTPLRASQSLSEAAPCTGYKTCSLKGKALRGNRVARTGI